jgi:glutathione synthase/RimK-type ligase-like ATP-grasp enzyme
LLNNIPGLLMPATRRYTVAQMDHLSFPVTIRPVGTQGGNGLEKLETRDALNTYVARYPDTEFYVANYVDYRSADGCFRKLRIALIDGKPYVCHLAISDHWMVHYRSAEMHLSAHKRADEAQLMQRFEQDFASRHRLALAAVAQRLGLDYVVLDCAETIDGSLLVFEADSRGWIHATDPVDIFPYKPVVMQKAFDAFRSMLLRRQIAVTSLRGPR